jgi:histidine triad (HIT) family protein
VYHHAPEGYNCPFCAFLQGHNDQFMHQHDVVLRDALVTAFIAPLWWPNNEGHVLIIPNGHFESLYDLPQHYAHRIQDVIQRIALAFKHVYHCHGVSTRQHNEPAGGQDVWHFHVHVFLRYEGDNLYREARSREIAPPQKRLAYAEQLKTFLASTGEEEHR